MFNVHFPWCCVVCSVRVMHINRKTQYGWAVGRYDVHQSVSRMTDAHSSQFFRTILRNREFRFPIIQTHNFILSLAAPSMQWPFSYKNAVASTGKSSAKLFFVCLFVDHSDVSESTLLTGEHRQNDFESQTVRDNQLTYKSILKKSCFSCLEV